MTFLQKHQRQMWLGYVRTWRGPVPGTCHLLIRAGPLSCVASTRPRSTDKILPSDPFEHFTKRFWPEHRKLRRTRKDYCANSRPCEVTLLMLRAPAPLVHPLQILAPRASSKMIGRATALFCYWKTTCTFQIIPAYKSEKWKNDKRKKKTITVSGNKDFPRFFFYKLTWSKTPSHASWRSFRTYGQTPASRSVNLRKSYSGNQRCIQRNVILAYRFLLIFEAFLLIFYWCFY